MQVPNEVMPVWAQVLIGILGGGAAVRLLSVWLENRRLEREAERRVKGQYRDTLFERIRELELENDALHQEIATLREELGTLRARVDRNGG